MNMRKRKKRWNIFIVLGLLFLAGALCLTLYNIKEDYDANRSAKNVQSQLEELILPEDDIDPDELPDDREMPTITIDGYDYIGYLSIPSIDLTLPVMDTWDYDRLQIAPCRFSGSLYKNNLVIAGHNYNHHFGPLRTLSPGIEIQFTDVEGHLYRYEISDLITLNPIQVEDLTEDSAEWDLSLFTCTLDGRTRHTVRCTRIN